MICSICISDFDQDEQLRFPCGCEFCPSCALEWISTSIQNKYSEEHIVIKCLNSDCNQAFLFPEVKDILNTKQQTIINETLLVNYIRKNINMRCCPNKDCNYAGFTEDKVCHSPLVCVKCDNKWFESAHRPKYNEYKNSLWEWLYTKKCPRCKVSIQKTDGCSHMTCEHCKFEFCWSCMKERFGTHSPFYCFLNRVQYLGFVLVAVCFLLWMTNSHQYPLYAVDLTIRYTFTMTSGGYQLFSYLVEFNTIYYILAFVVTNIMILAVGLTIIFSLDLTTIESYVGLALSIIFSIGSSCLVYWWFFRASIIIFAIELIVTVIVNWRNETSETEAKKNNDTESELKKKKKKKKRGTSKKTLGIKKSNGFAKLENILKKI